MIIQELLKKASIDNILNIIIEKYYKDRNYTPERLQNLISGLKNAYIEMIEIIPIIDENWVIIVDYTLDDLGPETTDKFYLDTYLFDKREIKNKFKIDSIVENNIDVNSYSYNEMIEYIHSRPFITNWGYEFSPWTEVMGFSVWQGSIDEYGIDTYAAAILYEATFSGFSQAEVEKRANEILNRSNSIDESVNIDNLSDADEIDEPKIDDDLNSLIEEFKEKTEEEQQNELLESLKISHKNWISLYYKLKKIYEEQKED